MAGLFPPHTAANMTPALAKQQLQAVGSLIESPTDTATFAASGAFVSAMQTIVEDYKEGNTASAFCTHKCYELTIFILLALVDSSAVLKVFASAVSTAQHLQFIANLGATILRDEAYLTQEIALDILCRLYKYLEVTLPKTAALALKSLHKELLREPIEKLGAVQILKDTRPTLQGVNKHNPNVFNYPAASFSVSIAPTRKHAAAAAASNAPLRLDIASGGYLDVSRSHLTLNRKDVVDLPGAKVFYPSIARLQYPTANSAELMFGKQQLPDELLNWVFPDFEQPNSDDAAAYAQFVSAAKATSSAGIVVLLELQQCSKKELDELEEVLEQRMDSRGGGSSSSSSSEVLSKVGKAGPATPSAAGTGASTEQQRARTSSVAGPTTVSPARPLSPELRTSSK
jgi:hypothetical protein